MKCPVITKRCCKIQELSIECLSVVFQLCFGRITHDVMPFLAASAGFFSTFLSIIHKEKVDYIIWRLKNRVSLIAIFSTASLLQIKSFFSELFTRFVPALQFSIPVLLKYLIINFLHESYSLCNPSSNSVFICVHFGGWCVLHKTCWLLDFPTCLDWDGILRLSFYRFHPILPLINHVIDD